jgi:endogenous inhibitor of DNA gyrase (YacG/DUF329 family)
MTVAMTRRTTCVVCGAALPKHRRTFCSANCKRLDDRRDFAQAYRDRADVRAKQRARQKAWRVYRQAKPCQVCGTTEDVQRDHFAGYDKPLTIRWLCRRHHAETHRKRVPA